MAHLSELQLAIVTFRTTYPSARDVNHKFIGADQVFQVAQNIPVLKETGFAVIIIKNRDLKP